MVREQDDSGRRDEELLQPDQEAIKPLVKLLAGTAEELQSEEELRKWQKMEQGRDDTLGWHQVLYSKPLAGDLDLYVLVGLPQLSENDPARDSVEGLIVYGAYIGGRLTDQFSELVESSRKERDEISREFQEKIEGKDLISLRDAAGHFLIVDAQRGVTTIQPFVKQLGYALRHIPGFEPINWTPIGTVSAEMISAEEEKSSKRHIRKEQAANLFQLLQQPGTNS